MDGKKLYHGAAYYPELWDEKVIEEDIRYMKEAGINVIRIGEFAWAKMESIQDQINIDFFVQVIKRFHDEGIETIMCTPTPTPPIWISHDHPERMYVDSEGNTMSHGARQHICTNHPFFRERSLMIVEAIAKAVGKLPGVIGWQIDNEFKCHVSECMCQTCKELWHLWLKEKYKTIDQLNEAWGTEIWSEAYLEFEQVPQPVKTPFLHNASLITAYRQFSREKIVEFLESQVNIIREYSKAPITHNTGRSFDLDNELLFANLDFASFDAYPDSSQYTALLLQYDLFRTMKKGKPFWVMETSTSHNGYLAGHQKNHPTGFLEAEAVSGYAQGAQGFSYWLWRQQRTGCELSHGAVLSAWGKPTVGFKRVMDVSAAIKKMEPMMEETIPLQAEVAITFSDRARSFFLTEPLEGLNYNSLLQNWYDTVLDTGIHRDLIMEGGDLKGYKLLMTPYVPYLSDALRKKGEEFAKQGGIWIVGPMTGYRTEEHTVHRNAALGDLEKTAGVESLYWYPISQTNSVGKAFGTQAPLGHWATVFDPETSNATVIGTVRGGESDGSAFITEKVIGNGKIIMIGAEPIGDKGKLMLSRLIHHYAAETGVQVKTITSNGTIVIPRIAKDGRYRLECAVNMDGKGGVVTVQQIGKDALTGKTILPGQLSLEPYEYRFIKYDI
ncbi:beta-galactosidase [Evansella vedderi]|uniref:Beta-galactosidase n=1 Tax=Evansella vedderi TaxID=38282 RepID=A0ABU0A3U2_9BACI|nr:beta-galactosidase [Evansella vedderi]MDQ0257348.1 beta-galactosidase [Evansella vedderi]